jgi:4-hydroxybenzoate polyprenyltransferase
MRQDLQRIRKESYEELCRMDKIFSWFVLIVGTVCGVLAGIGRGEFWFGLAMGFAAGLAGFIWFRYGPNFEANMFGGPM